MEEARADIKEQIKPDPTIRPPKYDIVSEGFNPHITLPDVPIPPQPAGIVTGKENSRMNHIAESLENSWLKFANWIKKSIAMMIIFILLGGTGGLYIAKFIYDFRMKEITMIGGFVHDKRVYDVKLRP